MGLGELSQAIRSDSACGNDGDEDEDCGWRMELRMRWAARPSETGEISRKKNGAACPANGSIDCHCLPATLACEGAGEGARRAGGWGVK